MCVFVSLVLSVVRRLKRSLWRSWLGCFPASTRSSWAPLYASCSTSPSTRRCAARWSRPDSFPNSPHCSVISLAVCAPLGCFCACVYWFIVCVYDWGLPPYDWQKQTPVMKNIYPSWAAAGASNLLFVRRLCRCSFQTAARARASSGDH